MRTLKNPYNYDLSKLQTLLVNNNGDIIGGLDDRINYYKKGSKLRLPVKGCPTLRVKATKRILIVEEAE